MDSKERFNENSRACHAIWGHGPLVGIWLEPPFPSPSPFARSVSFRYSRVIRSAWAQTTNPKMAISTFQSRIVCSRSATESIQFSWKNGGRRWRVKKRWNRIEDDWRRWFSGNHATNYAKNRSHKNFGEIKTCTFHRNSPIGKTDHQDYGWSMLITIFWGGSPFHFSSAQFAKLHRSRDPPTIFHALGSSSPRAVVPGGRRARRSGHRPPCGPGRRGPGPVGPVSAGRARGCPEVRRRTSLEPRRNKKRIKWKEKLKEVQSKLIWMGWFNVFPWTKWRKCCNTWEKQKTSAFENEAVGDVQPKQIYVSDTVLSRNILYYYMANNTQTWGTASDTYHKLHTRFLFEPMSNGVESWQLLPWKSCNAVHVTTLHQQRIRPYNASVDGWYIWYICGGLGVVISWLPPRRAHAWEYAFWLSNKIGYYPLDFLSDDKSTGRSLRMKQWLQCFCKDVGCLVPGIDIFTASTTIRENFWKTRKIDFMCSRHMSKFWAISFLHN